MTWLFVDKYFNQAKVTKLRTQIQNFRQGENENIAIAWDWFNELFFYCPYHRLNEPNLMQNFHNSIRQHIQGLLDAAAGSALMQQKVEDANIIIKRMALGSPWQYRHQRWRYYHLDCSTSHARRTAKVGCPEREQDKFTVPAQAATSQDAYIRGELDKILGLGRNGQVLTLFTTEIHMLKLSMGFVEPDLWYYNGSTDRKAFLSTFKSTLTEDVPQIKCVNYSLNTFTGLPMTSTIDYWKGQSIHLGNWPCSFSSGSSKRVQSTR